MSFEDILRTNYQNENHNSQCTWVLHLFCSIPLNTEYKYEWTQNMHKHMVWMNTKYEWAQGMNEHRVWINTGYEWAKEMNEHWWDIWEQQTSASAGELWFPRNVTISADSPVSALAWVSCQKFYCGLNVVNGLTDKYLIPKPVNLNTSWILTFWRILLQGWRSFW